MIRDKSDISENDSNELDELIQKLDIEVTDGNISAGILDGKAQ